MTRRYAGALEQSKRELIADEGIEAKNGSGKFAGLVDIKT